MKRYFALLFALLLLLSGCGEKSETTAEEVDFENLCVAMEDGSVVDGLDDWLDFYFLGTYSKKSEITISSTYDGVTYESILSYDGETYTLAEDGQTRSYKHLIYSSQNLTAQSKYDFAEYYLLSDDPEMTAERYFDYMVSSVYQSGFSPTTIVISDYVTFDRAETFGTVPAKFAFKENLSLFQNATFGKNGFYQTQVRSLSSPDSSQLSETARKCYSYEFKALTDNSLPQEEWDCRGYYRGMPISYDDKLFDAKSSDRLPDTESIFQELNGTGVFDYGAGYILVRTHRLAPWKHNHPARDYQPSYCELIVTAYDASGAALWQTTSDIFIG